ncbi:MAG: PilW family protein [Methylococcaceae bacterium]
MHPVKGQSLDSAWTQRGSSLVELMIALSLGLVLLTLVTRLAMETRHNMDALTERGEEREAGRYALSTLRNDLRLAGFLGALHRWPPFPDTLPDACAKTLAGLLPGLSVPLQIDDRPATTSRCVDGAMSGVERLVIRHADTHGFTLDAGADDDDGDGDQDDLDYGRVYLQGFDNRYTLGYCSQVGRCTAITNCSDSTCRTPMAPGLSRTISGDEMTVFGMRYRDGLYPVDLRAYQVHIYYLRTWSSTSGDGIPTLVRAELQDRGSAPGLISSPLLDNVEQIRYEYGLDGLKPARPSEWAVVTAVRVGLLIRSAHKQTQNPTPSHYDLGGGTPYILPVDAQAYRHHALTTLIRLDNEKNSAYQR